LDIPALLHFTKDDLHNPLRSRLAGGPANDNLFNFNRYSRSCDFFQAVCRSLQQHEPTFHLIDSKELPIL
jgi:hypothetical protein